MANQAVLSISGMSVSLPNGEHILQDINLQVREGSILGVIGESGTGKSMVGKSIAGTLPKPIAVNQGELKFNGMDLLAMPAAERRAMLGRDIGFIPQEPMTALNPVRTIGSQFHEHLKRIGTKVKSERQARALALLDEVGLPYPDWVLDSYPHQLSGGMLQRVLIAMAFASNPKLVIADEPTTALDVSVQAKVVDLIARMREQHQTSVLFITHDLNLAADVCDEVAVLYAGSIVETGPSKQILAEPSHPYTRCLNLASPSLTDDRSLLILPHAMPGVAERSAMSGCAFCARCPVAGEGCENTKPNFVDISDEHRSACHFPTRTMDISSPADRREEEHVLGDKLLLEAINVGKVYTMRDWLGRTNDVRAMSELKFTIREHEFVGVVGESGSGKTTLTRVISGLEDITSGAMRIAGLDRRDKDNHGAIRDLVQLVFQDPQSALNPRRKVSSLLLQTLEARHQLPDKQAQTALIKELLAQVKLPEETAQRYPDQLSGGQKQRVNIARALCSRPRLLIADEIVSGLDVSVQAQILELLREFRQEAGFSLLLISHDLAVVRHVCDSAIVMHQGRIVEQGPVEELFSNPQHSYTKKLIAAAGGKVLED